MMLLLLMAMVGGCGTKLIIVVAMRTAGGGADSGVHDNDCRRIRDDTMVFIYCSR